MGDAVRAGGRQGTVIQFVGNWTDRLQRIASLAGLTDFEIDHSETGDPTMSVPLTDDRHLTVEPKLDTVNFYGMTLSYADGELFHYRRQSCTGVVAEIKRLVA